MINQISDDYRKWLCRHVTQEGCVHKPQALDLIEQLEHVRSIEGFQTLLSDTWARRPMPLLLEQEAPDLFMTQLTSRLQRANQVLALYTPEIMVRLDGVSTQQQTHDLIDLIKQVLSSACSLLHERAYTLLVGIQDMNTLQRIVDHLEVQPHKPCPINPRSGSFDAIKPLNPQHAVCLGLLRNNSGTFRDENICSRNANQLLQTLLAIYQDLHTERPGSEKDLDMVSESRWCSLL